MTRLLQCIVPLLFTFTLNLDLPAPAAAQRAPAAQLAPADQPDAAAALDAKVTELWRAAKFAEAAPLALRVVAMREKQYGPDSPNLARALNVLNFIYRMQGRYAEAEPVAQRALDIREKALGPDHPDVAESLNNLAFLYQIASRFADAEPLYKRSLAIREKALGPDHQYVAQSLSDMASLYIEEARYAEAEPLYKRALAIQEKTLGPDSVPVGDTVLRLGIMYNEQARYAEAEPLFKRALANYEKSRGPDHPYVADALNYLAVLYRKEERYADAEPLLQRALAIKQKAFGPDHTEVASTLNSLGNLYQAQDRFPDGEANFKRALAIWEKTDGLDSSNVAMALSNLANLYWSARRFADAEPVFKRSLEISQKVYGPEHPRVANTMMLLANVYDDQARYAEAEPLYKQSLDIREKMLGDTHPDTWVTLNNLANLYGDENRFADALPWAQRVIDIGHASQEAVLQVLLGARRDKLIAAETALDESLSVVQRAAQTSVASAISKLAVRLAAGSDRLAQLVRQDQDLAAETERLDKSLIAAVSKETSKRDPAAEQRFRTRTAAIVDERAALQNVLAAEFPDYTALSNPQPLTAHEIQALLADDEALVLLAAGDRTRSFVFALTRDSADWTSIPIGTEALAQQVARFRRGLDVDMVADQGSLDASGIKRELFDLGFANELYASLLGPVEPLIKHKRHLIVVPFGPLTALPFHLLVTTKPAVALPTFAGTVTVGAMAPYRDAAWLTKRQAVSVMPSVASLKALRQFVRKDQAAKPIVGFGDPVFNPSAAAAAASQRDARKVISRSLATRSFTDFWQGAGVDRSRLGDALPQLPDTADELRAVALELGAPLADIHLGRDASEANVKRAQLSDYRVVYFATHGLVAGDIKGLAEPSLALTIPAQPSDLDDGLLTASEVAQLKLNADWVVLSACNTIAGDRPGAEALSGLARAFFYAGGRALLVSHWSVASDAATRLTTSTFDILKADPKLGRAEAMRRAMLAYLADQSQPRNAYPAIWAPFSIIGEGAAR